MATQPVAWYQVMTWFLVTDSKKYAKLCKISKSKTTQDLSLVSNAEDAKTADFEGVAELLRKNTFTQLQ